MVFKDARFKYKHYSCGKNDLRDEFEFLLGIWGLKVAKIQSTYLGMKYPCFIPRICVSFPRYVKFITLFGKKTRTDSGHTTSQEL